MTSSEIVVISFILMIICLFFIVKFDRENQRKARMLRDERSRLAQEVLEKAAEQNRRALEEAERKHKERIELAARTNWQSYYAYKSLTEIAGMSGLEFEQLLARLLLRIGYTDIRLTPVNDQGGDIICNSIKGISTVIQAKRWKKPLGNKVVQEILGAMLNYDCQAGLVITNSTFTLSAKELASKDPRIKLCDYFWLEPLMKKHFTPDIPEFSWDVYNTEVVNNLGQVLKRPKRANGVKPRRKYGDRRRYWR